MKIEDYADVLNLELVIRRHPNQKNRYTARFDKCDTKNSASSHILCSVYGEGENPYHAIQDYAFLISGKVLVVSALNPECRRSYEVPWALTLS